MLARATLALLLAGPVLAAAPGGSAFADTAPRKAATTAPMRHRPAHLALRRTRAGMATATRTRAVPSAIVASFDDGLAYDTPRDAQGRPIRTPAAAPKAWQVGTASWYGGAQWQGHRMSDGTRYEQDRLTAAHLSLPLGTLVRVSRMDDNRSVVVRITDRPGTRKRVIDLSRGAAAQLGMLSAGLAQVRIDPL